jgi:hypothetical protein
MLRSLGRHFTPWWSWRGRLRWLTNIAPAVPRPADGSRAREVPPLGGCRCWSTRFAPSRWRSVQAALSFDQPLKTAPSIFDVRGSPWRFKRALAGRLSRPGAHGPLRKTHKSIRSLHPFSVQERGGPRLFGWPAALPSSVSEATWHSPAAKNPNAVPIIIPRAKLPRALMSESFPLLRSAQSRQVPESRTIGR